MDKYLPDLEWLNTQHAAMVSLVETWSNVNSGSDNLAGLEAMLALLKEAFAPLGGAIEEVVLPPITRIDESGNTVTVPVGKALWLRKHSDAPVQVFLGGHIDTVFAATSTFQKAVLIDHSTMRGPGVADIKGGLVVMLKALQALEKSSFAGKVGWEVFLNPDEEIGSLASAPLLKQCASRNDVGLVFEPSLPDGSFVSARKGSGNFTIVAHGRAAHAGRDFTHGRNAVTALARVINDVDALNSDTVNVNVANFEGGTAVNVVPDLAITRINARVTTAEEMTHLQDRLQSLVTHGDETEGITMKLYGQVTRPPKPFDAATEQLFDHVKETCNFLGLPASWHDSGGVCDGNVLAAAGLPTIDTLGVVGGNIHTSEEYVLLDSLTQRARLTALLLMRFANQEMSITTETSHG